MIPFCDIHRKENGQIEAKFSVEIELLRLLEKYFNFRSHFIDSHQVWGNIENGTWTGNVGLVYNKVSFPILYLKIIKSFLT